MFHKLFSEKKNHEKVFLLSSIALCLVFFIAYSVLSIVRHSHYQSFGYDLGINSQTVWRYSNFQLPYTTSDPFPNDTKLAAHVEIVYALISPFYWIYSSEYTLLVVEAAFLCSAGVAVFLLARKRKLHPFVSLSFVVGFLGFYGVQNAVWFDVHSASFAAAFLAWFLYFLDNKRFKLSVLFCVLAFTSKENIGFITALTSMVYFIKRRDKLSLLLMAISSFYLLFIYLVYFKYLTPHEYLYKNKSGLLSNINPISFIDSSDKRDAILYSFLSFGFLPLLLPIYLIPIIGDLGTYFVLASDLTASHGLFMHYRVTLAPLLAWASIMVIVRFKFLNRKILGVYLIICVLFVQYVLHLPLSYLVKEWFWTEPTGVKNINTVIGQLSVSDSVVAQNNILSHISNRDKIYTLYPEKRAFSSASPCGNPECSWFRWEGDPRYLIVDVSPEWDIRHFLTDRELFLKGLFNLEKAGIVEKENQIGSTTVYRVLKRPGL